MSYGNNTGIAVVLVALLVIGTASVFMISQFWQDAHPDPNTEGHDYIITGTLDGEDCTGTGSSSYKNESLTVYLFQFKFEVSSASGSDKGDFGFICDRDGIPESDLYDYIGEDEISGVPVTVWHQKDKTADITFYLADECKVMRFLYSADGMELIGEIVQVLP